MNPKVKVAYERRWWVWHNVVLEIPVIKLWISESLGVPGTRSWSSIGYGNPQDGEETIVHGQDCRRICPSGVRRCLVRRSGIGIRVRRAVGGWFLYILYPSERAGRAYMTIVIHTVRRL
jgi:hypothetical protein